MVCGTSPRLRDQNRTELENREREKEKQSLQFFFKKEKGRMDGGQGARKPFTRDKENTKRRLACVYKASSSSSSLFLHAPSSSSYS